MSKSSSAHPLTYQEARARLYSLEHWGVKLGLDNIREFCEDLGNPQDRFLSVHVAGTNGKGSTSAYLDSILRTAGYRVGRYTSPHLRDFRERIHISGLPVSPTWVTEFVDQHWDKIVERRYSYFEVTTALAFAAFARAKVEIAVVEVGLGGRFDATNVIDPIACVITRIARDHEHVLGHTPAEIAYEKAGIIKPGVPVVIGPLVPEAETRIREIADERMAPIWTAHELLSTPPDGSEAIDDCYPLKTPLSGAHQLTNLAVAVAAIRLLKAQGLEITPQQIHVGVAQTRWAARFQVVPGSPTVVYDAGHNPDGASAVVATWRRIFGQERAIGIFNTRPDKNHREILAILSKIISTWIFCPMPDSPCIAREELLAFAAGQNQPARWIDSPKKAMTAARAAAGPKGQILVTGSHYLVGAVIPPKFVWEGVSDLTPENVSLPQLLAAAQDRGAPF